MIQPDVVLVVATMDVFVDGAAVAVVAAVAVAVIAVGVAIAFEFANAAAAVAAVEAVAVVAVAVAASSVAFVAAATGFEWLLVPVEIVWQYNLRAPSGVCCTLVGPDQSAVHSRVSFCRDPLYSSKYWLPEVEKTDEPATVAVLGDQKDY